jgi:hypothetical protein
MATSSRPPVRVGRVRAGRGLAEGHAASLFDLGVTLTRLSEIDGGASSAEARQALAEAAERFDALGMPERAGLARESATLRRV